MHNVLFIALENINFVRNQDLLIGLKARLKEVEKRLTPMTDKGTYYFKLSSSRKSIGGINNGVYREKY